MTVQYSTQKMVSDGTLSTIALGIQYLQRNDIYMRIAGEETPQVGAPSGYTWSFINNMTLKILPVVPNGVEVVVYRRTDVDAMYNIYSQNAQFDEATIDENNQQLLYIAQEYLEQGATIGVDTIEYLRDDGTFTYYRTKRTDGSYSEEFAVPSASSSTKVLTREALRRSYAEAGYNLVDGSFEAGGTLTSASDVLLHEASGKAYGWAGAFPKVVAAGSGVAGFVDKSILFAGAGVVRNDRFALRDIVSVRDFGASAAATASENLAAFKAAVDSVNDGGCIVIPADSGPYNIETSGGLSSAIDVNKRIELVFEGDVKATYGALQANPPYIFRVSSKGVTFSGSGKLIGDGTINDENTGDDNTFPGLIYVAADNFTIRDVVISSPPKVGVMLRSCSNAKIHGCTFEGGPSVYTTGNTAYFSIRATGGGRHSITSNHFIPDSNNGRTINAIFFGGVSGKTDNCIIANNIAQAPHEKLSYLYGDYNIVMGNHVENAQNTDAYRHQGSYNKLIGNVAKDCKGACQVFDGVGNEISGNTFTGLTQAGIIVSSFSAAYTGGFKHTKIIGNTVVGASGTKTDGIRVNVDGASSSGIVIANNIVSSMSNVTGEGLIRLIAQSPYSIDDAVVTGNYLISGTNGVLLNRVVRSNVSNNTMAGCTNFPIVETGGSFNYFTNNRGRNLTNIGISGLAATSSGSGNQWTDAKLSGQMTCDANAATTVTHGGVAPNAFVFLQPTSSTAGVLVTSKGMPYTSVSATDFIVRMANGAAAAGGERFAYNIIQ